MKQQNFDINKMRVASPCSVGWETMTGDERVRRCDSCELNVFNTAELTRCEIENLISEREGRLCIRLYKRTDGTVLTKDCPVGFRAYQKRVARFAGAAFATILGLFSVGFGQIKKENCVKGSNIKIIRTENRDDNSILFGKVTDTTGAVVPGAEIKLFESGKKTPKKIVSDSEGNYGFYSLSKGVYKLEITVSGFKVFSVEKLEINDREKINILPILQGKSETVIVGLYGEPNLIDTSSSSVTTTITSDMMEKIPH